MNTFQLEIGTLVAYKGLAVHDEGKVIGIDFYSKIEDSNVVKTWTSYSITSSPDLDVETQMAKGDRWWITWDGSNLREWTYATEEDVDLSGSIVKDITGDIAVTFEGDSGVSTSQGQLFVYQTKENSDIWHSKEEFYTTLGNKEVIYFVSKPISDAAEITITDVL